MGVGNSFLTSKFLYLTLSISLIGSLSIWVYADETDTVLQIGGIEGGVSFDILDSDGIKFVSQDPFCTIPPSPTGNSTFTFDCSASPPTAVNTDLCSTDSTVVTVVDCLNSQSDWLWEGGFGGNFTLLFFSPVVPLCDGLTLPELLPF